MKPQVGMPVQFINASGEVHAATIIDLLPEDTGDPRVRIMTVGSRTMFQVRFKTRGSTIMENEIYCQPIPKEN